MLLTVLAGSTLVAGLSMAEFGVQTHVVSHADGTRLVHPGESIILRRSAHGPPDTPPELFDSTGRRIELRTRTSGDGRVLHVQPTTPLEWDAQYELCHHAVEWTVGALDRGWQTCGAFGTMEMPPAEGPADAPILTVEGRHRPFARYYADILTAEGLGLFASIPLEEMTGAALATRSVVILDSADLRKDTIADLSDWVGAGGLLVAMRPGDRVRNAFGLARGAEMREIATAMDWSIKKATDVIERYIALHPDMTDALGAKLERLRANESGSKV